MQQVVTAGAGVCNLNPHVVTQIPLNTERPLLYGRNLERIAGNRQTDGKDRRIRSASSGVAQKCVIDADALIRFRIRESVLFDYTDKAAIVVDAISTSNRHLTIGEWIPCEPDARAYGIIVVCLDVAAKGRVFSGKDDTVKPVTAAWNDRAIWIVLDRVRRIVELRQK